MDDLEQQHATGGARNPSRHKRETEAVSGMPVEVAADRERRRVR